MLLPFTAYCYTKNMRVKKIAFFVILGTFTLLSALYVYTLRISEPKALVDVSPKPAAPEIPLLGEWEVEQTTQSQKSNLTLYVQENGATTTESIQATKVANLVLENIETLEEANYYVDLFEQYYIDRLAEPTWAQSNTTFGTTEISGEDSTGVGGNTMSFFAKLKGEFMAIVISSTIKPKDSTQTDLTCPCDVEFQVKESGFIDHSELQKK